MTFINIISLGAVKRPLGAKHMKRIFALLCFAAMVCCCTPEKGPDTPVKEWKDTYNGQFVLAMADAYSYWEENNKLQSYIKWEGVTVFTPEYVRAGVTLALNMVDNAENWMDEDVVYPTATFGLTSDNPFIPQEIPFDAFVQLLRIQYKSISEDHAVLLNMQIPGYEPNLSTTGLAVMLCRAFAYYAQNGKFPDTINTWESSYLHQTSHMDLSSQIIKDARDAAWNKAGVTAASTVREKATAIFNYARDEWKWEDYYNTKKGAEGTITAKGGNCCDLSNAVVAMARISGIPARYFHAQCHYSSGYIGHVISQMFIDGEWVMADASNDSNKLGTVAFTDYTNLHYYEDLQF